MTNVFALIISFVLFFGGLALLAYSPEWTPGLPAAAGFFGGILAISASFGLPVHVWSRTH